MISTPAMPRLALLVAALTGCSEEDPRVPLVVYSPHGEDILAEFEKMFEAANPDVDVRTFNQPAQTCLTRIRAERENPRCDVWWGAPDTTFARAASDGLLDPYTPSYASALPAGTFDPDYRYTGQFALPQVILYNANRMEKERAPATWAALATDEWKDRIVLRAPLDSGGMRTSFSWLVAYHAQNGSFEPGFDWLRALTRNTKRLCANPQELFEAVTKDDAGVVTIWNLADAIFQRDRYGYPFAVSIPEEGVPLVVDGIALVKKSGSDATRAAAARRFYEFVNTLESQSYLADHHGRIPLRLDFTDSMKPEWARALRFRPLPIDPAIAARNEDAWMRRWDETIKASAKQ